MITYDHIFFALLFSIILLGFASCKNESPAASEPIVEDDYPYPAGRIYLSHLPVDTDRVDGFLGLGNMNVLPEDHGGFFTPRDGWYEEPLIPIYAPADGKIVEIIKDWYEWFAPYGDDYSVAIKVSTTMTVSFGHMSDLSPRILEAAGELQTGYAIPNRVDIEVEAGEIIGYIGTQGAVDWYIRDSELELDFVNPDRYPLPWLISGCYHDYYRGANLTRLSDITLRTAEPRCGKIDYDVAGRIAGNWFWEDEVPENAFNDYTTHLAIVYDEFLGYERVVISDGYAGRPESPHEGDERFTMGAGRPFWVKNNSPLPEGVGISDGIIKYEIMDRSYGSISPGLTIPDTDDLPVAGVFLVEMLDESTIRVERFMNKTADEVEGFGSNSRIYIR